MQFKDQDLSIVVVFFVDENEKELIEISDGRDLELYNIQGIVFEVEMKELIEDNLFFGIDLGIVVVNGSKEFGVLNQGIIFIMILKEWSLLDGFYVVMLIDN